MNGDGVVPVGLSLLGNASLIPLDAVEYQSDLAARGALSAEKEKLGELANILPFPYRDRVSAA